MTRPEAINLRSRQLSGEPVDPALLAQALAVIQAPEPSKKRTGRPPNSLRQLRQPHQPKKLPPGPKGVQERANRVLLSNLQALRGGVK